MLSFVCEAFLSDAFAGFPSGFLVPETTAEGLLSKSTFLAPSPDFASAASATALVAATFVAGGAFGLLSELDVFAA